ncbi:alpha/beta hydrolase family protein [Ereboglobus luteus]|nr:prolyl oligopeptidase family serine peptidase [Ereboglobus luteus]
MMARILILGTLLSAGRTLAGGDSVNVSPVPVLSVDQNKQHYTKLFQPPEANAASLSPDGHLIAYAKREQGRLYVYVVNADKPEQAVVKKEILIDQDATDGMDDAREYTPAEMLWMGWVTPSRLVMEVNRKFLALGDGDGQWGSLTGMIIAMDSNGDNAISLATPRDLQKIGFEGVAERGVRARTGKASARAESASGADLVYNSDDASAPLSAEDETVVPTGDARFWRSPSVIGFCPDDAESILVRANAQGKSNYYGVYKINALTGKRTLVSEQEPAPLCRVLSDRLGNARIYMPRTTDATFPHRYLYAKTKGFMRWQNLDNMPKTDASVGGFSVSPDNYFGTRSIPLGFDYNSTILYYASNIGRDAYGIYALNVESGEPVKFAVENAKFDMITPDVGGFPGGREGSSVLVFDRHTLEFSGIHFTDAKRTTRWVNPVLQSVQASLEAALPGRIVTVLEWNSEGSKYLVKASAPSDPGAYYIYNRITKELNEFVQKSPWLNNELLHEAIDFGFPTADKSHVTGIITIPSQIRSKKIPVVVVCPDYPWDRVQLDFSPETQAIATMGFAVIEVNSRSAWGYGIKRRESASVGERSELQALDILTALDKLAQYLPLDLQHVAVMGHNYGGYTAMRVLQLHQDRFRCAIAVNAPLDPNQWLNDIMLNSGDAAPLLTRKGLDTDAELRAAPLMKAASNIKKPVCVFNYRGRVEAEDSLAMRMYAAGERFVESVRINGVSGAAFHSLENDYMRGLPLAKAGVCGEIEGFLNATMYNFNVNMGPIKMIDSNSNADRASAH